jgi:hypothetical protein
LVEGEVHILDTTAILLREEGERDEEGWGRGEREGRRGGTEEGGGEEDIEGEKAREEGQKRGGGEEGY